MTQNTETLDKLYLEWSQFTKAETAKEIALKKLVATMMSALIECEDYFDQRADADCDQDGFIPNDEMRLLSVVRDAIHKAPATE